MRKLSPPTRVRPVKTRCCASCGLRSVDADGYMSCLRSPDDPPWLGVQGTDAQDEYGIHYVVCDGWKRGENNSVTPAT